MNVLAIESSCDDTSIAVVRDGREVLACETLSQIKRHALFGGVVPEVASRCHLEAICQIFKLVLKESNLGKSDIGAVAVTYAPGLVGSLLVGVNFAKGVASALKVPLIAVNHIKGHIASNYIANKDLQPPFLCLVVSGGHTCIVKVRDYTKMKILGKTRDDAAGETFDKIGRCLGMAYPGGVSLDKVAENGDPDSFKFTVPHIKDGKYDFSFSGIKTSTINEIHKLKQKKSAIPIADISASLRQAVVKYLIQNLVKAAQESGLQKIALAGGVSANSLLRRRLNEECAVRTWQAFIPSLDLCGDNASMIGAQAYFEFLAGNIANMSLNACAS